MSMCLLVNPQNIYVRIYPKLKPWAPLGRAGQLGTGMHIVSLFLLPMLVDMYWGIWNQGGVGNTYG